MKALLIIDVQKAMIECENPVYRSTQVIENIHTLVNSARLSKTPIIYVQHNEENTEFQNGSKSWEIVENVKPEVSDTIIQKTYLDAFKETNLKDILVQKKINELIYAKMNMSSSAIKNNYFAYLFEKIENEKENVKWKT